LLLSVDIFYHNFKPIAIGSSGSQPPVSDGSNLPAPGDAPQADVAWIDA